MHGFGFVALTMLLVACGVCMSSRHEGVKSVAAALWLAVGAVALSRFTTIYLLHQPENATPVAALMLLVIGGSVWFGAPAPEYYPEAVFDGLQTYGAGGLDDTPEALGQ